MVPSELQLTFSIAIRESGAVPWTSPAFAPMMPATCVPWSMPDSEPGSTSLSWSA